MGQKASYFVQVIKFTVLRDIDGVKKKILVTGATGAVGPVLVRMLLEKGYCVRTLSRRMPNNAIFSDEVEVLTGDVTDYSAVERAVQGVYAIFHLAAKVHDNSCTEKYMKECRNVNIEGTRNIIRCAKAAEVNKIIFFSSINVYGRSFKNVMFKESSSAVPLTCYAKSKLAAERLLLEADKNKNSSLSCTILRVAAVYGKGVKGNYRLLVKMLKRGAFIQMGEGGNFRTLIHENDLADAAILAMEHPAARGEIYNVTDGGFHTYKGIISAICNALGRKARIIVFSDAATLRIVRILKCLSAIRIPFALTAAGLIEKQMETIQVSGDKIKTDIGFNPGYTLKNGWKEIL
jgi:UDP-glucose 4-epimerase